MINKNDQYNYSRQIIKANDQNKLSKQIIKTKNYNKWSLQINDQDKSTFLNIQTLEVQFNNTVPPIIESYFNNV